MRLLLVAMALFVLSGCTKAPDIEGHQPFKATWSKSPKLAAPAPPRCCLCVSHGNEPRLSPFLGEKKCVAEARESEMRECREVTLKEPGECTLMAMIRQPGGWKCRPKPTVIDDNGTMRTIEPSKEAVSSCNLARSLPAAGGPRVTAGGKPRCSCTEHATLEGYCQLWFIDGTTTRELGARERRPGQKGCGMKICRTLFPPGEISSQCPDFNNRR